MKKTGIAIIMLMILPCSCEKEKDYGSALYEGDEMITYLCWSENSDELYFTIERDNYRKSIYGVDINTGESWRVGDIMANYGTGLFLKDDKILYFNDLSYMNTKLYSLETSGGTPQMIIDSLEYPVVSTKYLAYSRYISLPDTSFNRFMLYDLDNKTESIINTDKTCVLLSISPDGSQILFGYPNYMSSIPDLVLYDTGTGLITDLPVSGNSYLINYFWIDNEVYAFSETGMGTYTVYNLVDRNKLSYPEPLTYNHSYIISPSGRKIAYLVVEPPALAEGLVGNHYYLHILKSGSSEVTVIDMERKSVFENTMIFSPDETRIAYVRDDTDIYVMTIE